jgi:hypothetical protein
MGCELHHQAPLFLEKDFEFSLQVKESQGSPKENESLLHREYIE